METKLYQLLVDMGIPTYVLLVFLIISILIKYKTVREWIYIKLGSIFSNKSKLRHHYLFTNVNYYEDLIDEITFEDEEKDWMFRAILYEKKDSIYKLTRSWMKEIKEKKLTKASKTVLKVEMKNLVQRIVEDYEHNIIHSYTDKYGHINGYRLYKKVYLDNGGFKDYHRNNISNLLMFIENLHLYENVSNFRIIFMFLGRIETALYLAIDDLYRLFIEYDGELLRIINEKHDETSR